MVSKTKGLVAPSAASAKRGSVRAPAGKRGAAQADAPSTASVIEAAPPNLLRAGLKALGNARDKVVQGQGRVFEVILGVEPGPAASGPAHRDSGVSKVAQEAFGLRKFEAVFDQRVVQALERMGMPSIEVLQALTDEVAALKAELSSLKAAKRKR